MSDNVFDRGLATRKTVLGDQHVENALARASALDADFQRFVTETAWGAVWSRPGMDFRTRHLITIGMLAALGRSEELALHVRSIARTGVTEADLTEVFLHVAVYAGVPAANAAIAIARRELEPQTRAPEGGGNR